MTKAGSQKTAAPSITSLILKDHRALKNCIRVLKNEDAPPKEVLEKGLSFLKTLKLHAEAEEKALYTKLKTLPEFHLQILEGYEEHAIAAEKLEELLPKTRHSRTLSDELRAQLKVLAEIVEHHVKEEESELLPEVEQEFDEEQLAKLGAIYMKERGFGAKDIEDLPLLKEEVQAWTDTVVDLSTQFKKKVDQYIHSLR